MPAQSWRDGAGTALWTILLKDGMVRSRRNTIVHGIRGWIIAIYVISALPHWGTACRQRRGWQVRPWRCGTCAHSECCRRSATGILPTFVQIVYPEAAELVQDSPPISLPRRRRRSSRTRTDPASPRSSSGSMAGHCDREPHLQSRRLPSIAGLAFHCGPCLRLSATPSIVSHTVDGESYLRSRISPSIPGYTLEGGSRLRSRILPLPASHTFDGEPYFRWRVIPSMASDTFDGESYLRWRVILSMASYTFDGGPWPSIPSRTFDCRAHLSIDGWSCLPLRVVPSIANHG
jgi:hypothetical protein